MSPVVACGCRSESASEWGRNMDYDEQAKDFLKSCDATMSIGFGQWSHNELWGETRDERKRYIVRIKTPRGSMTVRFWDSIANSKVGVPSEYDILSCLDPYTPDTFKEFCEEFGYADDSSAREIYKLCKKQSKDLHRIFTEEQLEELAEIV